MMDLRTLRQAMAIDFDSRRRGLSGGKFLFSRESAAIGYTRSPVSACYLQAGT
jgi:hypothetical protein